MNIEEMLNNLMGESASLRTSLADREGRRFFQWYVEMCLRYKVSPQELKTLMREVEKELHDK